MIAAGRGVNIKQLLYVHKRDLADIFSLSIKHNLARVYGGMAMKSLRPMGPKLWK